MASPAQPLRPGQRAPDFVLRRRDGTPTRFYAIAGGRSAVLVFRDGEVSLYDPDLQTPLEVLTDPDGAVFTTYGMTDVRGPTTGTAFVLDPNLRVLGVLKLGDDELARSQVHALLNRALPVLAPVLLVPNVLDEQACAWLINLWATQGSVETGVEVSREGRREETLSEVHKRRRDYTVTDPQVSGRIAGMVGRALIPELRKAFAYRATRFEGFKIGCYDASTGGFFRAHRDNLSPTTAHRRFALTLNLNDDYSGGQLRFPEYGPHLYRPPAGGALVFSCSHLHEVLDVTHGRRFVLLSFFYGDEDSRQRPS
jgi:predicted 2-oxoglutarate/Fe(II)-dependent dioxygenase YbiX